MEEVRKYLESKKVHNIDDFFTFKSRIFGGMNAKEFVKELVRIGNAKTEKEGWREVLGIAHKMYG